MKRLLLSLICVALGGAALGQNVLPNRAAMPNASVTSIGPGIPALHAQEIQTVAGHRHWIACPPGSACPVDCFGLKTICVPEPTIIKTTKYNYGSECGKICYQSPSGLGGLFHRDCNAPCDASCGANCGHAFNQKFLIKRVCITEEHTTKCVPVQVPNCGPSGHGIFHRQQSAPPAPAVEVIPQKPMPLPK